MIRIIPLLLVLAACSQPAAVVNVSPLVVLETALPGVWQFGLR